MVGTLPTGLSFDASTRQLSGAPTTVASATTYTYRVRDKDGDQASAEFTITVTNLTLTLTGTSDASWVKDIAKTVTLPEASGGDTPLTYSVAGSLPAGLSFDASTRELSGTASAVASATTYTYQVRDANGDEASDEFTVEVTNATPTQADVTALSWVKDIAKTVTLPEASGGDTPLTYSVAGSLPAGLSFDASTRELSGTASAVASATTYTYRVRDANGDEASDEFTVEVTNATPTLTGTSDASWVKDIAKTVTLPEASGGDTPLTYSVAGSLPAGLSFDASTRELSGTASAVASATTYTYQVRDANGDEASDEFTVEVTNATPTLTGTSDASWVKDIAKTVTLPEASGGDAPLTYSVAGSLPAGLSFDASTRELSGTASAVASATTYTYKVRDANGDEASDEFTVEVTNATPTQADVTALSWVKDIAKTVTLPEASGGDTPLTYSVVGSLPTGLSFDAATRELSGTASAVASATTYTYKVRDANGDEASDEFTVAVTNATPTQADVTALSWVKDIAKTVTLPEASGGDAPLTYSVAGSLPAGLSFDASTRQLSGTASAEANATTYTYKVRDANGDEASDEFTVAVTNATPTQADVTALSWVKDIAKTVTLPEASGGDAPLTYSVAGSLPAGLSFDASTRELSGTASAVASATTYTYQVRDANGDEASDEFTVEVTNATPTQADVTALSWVKDIAKTVTLPEASGGDTPLTYSVVGSLPAGLSFDASTRQLSGTASAEANATTYTYKVRDANGDEASDEFTVAVTNATPTQADVTALSWVKDIAKTVTLPEASGGDAPLTYSVVGSLSAGLSFDASTRQLSGTASAEASATTYTYKVRDANGDEASDEFTVEVTNATPTQADVTALSWVKDIAKTVTLPQASGGDTPLMYSVAGDLPTGLSFDASTRELSGTASAVASATTYTYQVRDANGDEASDEFTVAVTNATPTQADVTALSWVKDIAKTATLPEASGGDTPLTYLVVGSLPAGLSFDAATRQLSGTATAEASATTYTYKVRDANGDEASDEFTVAVTNATPTQADVTALSWVKDIAKTVTLPEASGGDTPLTYSVVGSLPAGLSFDASTRQLSGTASAEANATTYTYKVRDANGDEASDEFTVEVTNATPTQADVTALSWVKDIAKTVTLPEASGGDTPLTYSVAGSLPAGLSFDASTRQLSGTASAEANATTYTYQVRDANGDEASDEFTVAVTNATPTQADVTALSWVKDIAKTVTLPEASGGDTPLTYSVVGSLPTGLSFDASTRQLSGTASAEASATTYTYQVRDANGDEASDEFTVAVTNATPTQADVTALSWVKDIAKTVTLPEASGGDTPLTYSVAGSLPAGLSFDASTRQLSGTASAVANATTYTYKVRDANGDEASDEFTVEVTNATPTQADVTALSWVKDIAKTVTLPEASGGDTPLTYSVAGSLPAGLSFDASTRQLSGTASAVASATTYTYKVRDANGDEASDEFTVAVTNATPTQADVTALSWVKDIAKTVTLPEASGGDTPLTYSVVGSLPAGLSFDATTRQLSGTASAEANATTYTYKVRDANGDEASDEFTVEVTNATPTLTGTSDASWVKDIAKTVTLPEASGGDAPLTYSVVGSLPAGLSFDASTRQLSGTASAEASATTYTYKVRDANGDEASDEFTVAVTNATPTQADVTALSWVKDIAKTVTLPEASGGDAPLTYSVVGSLPAGLSFDAYTRELSGTASAVASATTYTYKVRDANGDEASDEFTVEVTNATPTQADVTALSWVKDIAKTATLPEASGGDTPLTYSVVGSLPAGLSFDAATRQLSGTATAEASATTYTYKVRDANGDEASDEFTVAVLEQSKADDSDPCALVPQDAAPTQPTLEGVPFLPAGPTLVSGNAELRVRLPSARTNALAPVLAWNFKLDHYKDESQLGTWTSVPEVWHMERAIAVTVLDSQAQPAASGVPAAAEDLARDLLFSRTEVPVARGSAASYAVRLATQPTADVTVTVAGPSESVGGLSISPAQLTFSASNWNHAQVVTVTAPAAEGEYRQATIGHAASGGGYDGVSGQVTAQESDASAKALTMSVNTLEVGEDSTVTYTLHLAAKPSSDVVLTIARTGQAGLSVDVDPLTQGDQNSLTFTPTDWNVVRTITVTAGSDDNALNETAQLEHALSGDGFGKRIGGLDNATSSACDSIYLLSVQAVNRLGASAYSTAVQATPTTVTPTAPANLQAEPGAGEITLSWSDPADDSITGYEYRYTTYSGTSSESRGLSAWQALEPTTQHVVQGMRFGVRYTFEVRALHGDLRGAVSRATAIPALADAVSRAPTGFVATWTTTAEGQLRWDADPVAATYEYRYSGDDGATWTDWQDAVATCDAASCGATATLNGTPEAYEFELRRRSRLNPDVARARTGTHPSAPKAPLLLAATPAGPAPVNQWQLTWTASTAGELVTGWQYRSVYLENPSGSLWTAWTDMQPATDEGGMSFTVMLGTEESKGQRMFQVRGTNASGVGEPSNAR